MRTFLIAALAVLVFEAGAQTPPVPPTPPTQPAPPSPPAPAGRATWPRPPEIVMPPAPPAPPREWRPEVGDLVHGTAIRPLDVDFNHVIELEAARHAIEASRLDHAAIALSVDRAAIRESSLRALEMSRLDMGEARVAMEMAMADVARAPHALAELSMLDIARAPRAFGEAVVAAGQVRREPTLHVVPREPWLPQDPADSLYRVARDLVNRGQYRSAAEAFRSISRRYPTSGYAPDVMYFEAYSLYKIGGQNELRQALDVLNRQKSRFPNAKVPDPGLLPRIQGELATRGDPMAARYVQDVASASQGQGQQCNKDDMTIRLEALNALSRMNPDSTTPILRRVLARRDQCSTSLRRQAITLMAKNPDAATVDIMIDVLRNDPAPEVRRAAISWLGEVPSDRGSAALDEVMRSTTETDEDMRAYALQAMASSRNPRAGQALRTVIERKDVSENLRRQAMMQLTRTDSAGAGAYLRTLYPKLESRRLQEYALTQIARLRGDDNQKWMLGFVRDTTEAVQLRRIALSALTRSTTTSLADIGGLYRTVPELELRQAIITSLAARKEPEAVDQLIAIYRASTDPKLHVQIINVLSRRDDPRTVKLLSEILNK